ncbi:putative protein kinase RLK-Pelle-L-LEC family [Helianthus annuus]|nr:putative protein kinase RLK-Pelle-L-LEC family [Helianthus annuus]
MGVVVATTLKTTVILLCFFSALARFETFTRSYPTFNKSLELQDFSDLNFQNDARISQDALQITADTSNNAVFDLRNQSGRVMFRQPFKLWDGDSVASFNTSFLVNMFPMNGNPGEGLAFLIAPTMDVPDNSYGQYLGLTNQTLDNEASDNVLAIELDTVKQPHDIDNNHIGLNINSIVSVVYRGVLPEDNVEVAVKWFSRESLKGEDDFLAELTIINRLRHKHLVRLLGWCHRNGKLLLVYEYMQKGSLDMHLFNVTGEPLSWTLRYKILACIGSALHYLHYEYDQKVVHRDIKASNIMLDSDFNARLGDFGLARALDNEKTSYAEAEGVLGTVGYIAPECFLTGKATQHSDIYAFGALLIEVVSGQRPGTKVNGFQFMVDYVWSLYREGRILEAVDKRLADDYNAEEATRFLMLGLACSHPIADERPKTHTIVQMLAGSVAIPHVPPFKPAFVWPAMMPIDDLSQATSINTAPHSISQYETNWSPLSRQNYSGYADQSTV